MISSARIRVELYALYAGIVLDSPPSPLLGFGNELQDPGRRQMLLVDPDAER